MVYAAVDQVLSNIDLLTQILLFVPAKPLIAFKQVSKSWSSLISHHQFQITHTRHHPPSLVSGFYYQNYYWFDKIIPISFLRSLSSIPKIASLENLRQCAPTICTEVKILDSCNGLILCHNLNKMTYSVLNPTTGSYKLLPEPLSPRKLDHSFLCFLAFDPSESYHYKVVFLKHTRRCDESTTVIILSSENQSCKKLSFLIPRDWSFNENRVVFWNGAINWISEENRHIQFIVEEERFTSVQIHEQGMVGYFGKCGHSLHLVKFHDIGAWSFRVFEMNKETNFWFLKLDLNLGLLPFTFPEMNPPSILGRLRYSVWSIEREINKDNFCFVLGIPGKIISYSINMDTNHTMTKVLGEFADYLSLTSYIDLHPFIQCLAPV